MSKSYMDVVTEACIRQKRDTLLAGEQLYVLYMHFKVLQVYIKST